MARSAVKKIDTSATLLAAAKKVLRKGGYSALSTRDVATAAGVPLSQIHYHFGSKEGLMLALFEYLNDELLDRQHAMFGNPALKLSEQWDLACTYLDEDLASGYVRVLQELWAAGYSNPQIAKVVRAGILRWQDLLTSDGRKAEKRFGSFAGLAPRMWRPWWAPPSSAVRPISCWGGEPGCPSARRCAALATSSARLKRASPGGDVMRAKLPDRKVFIERDGVNSSTKSMATAPETMLFIPPWSIVHSRIYKAQLPYFSERFRCITFDGRGNGKSDRPDRCRRLFAG